MANATRVIDFVLLIEWQRSSIEGGRAFRGLGPWLISATCFAIERGRALMSCRDIAASRELAECCCALCDRARPRAQVWSSLLVVECGRAL